LRLLDLAESLNESGDFAGMIDTERTAVTGHSFGGYTTAAVGGARLDNQMLNMLCQRSDEIDEEVLEEGVQQACVTLDIEAVFAEVRGTDNAPEGLWAPTTDSRIKALVPLAPGGIQLFGEEGVAGVQLPMLIIVGAGDTVTPPEDDAFVLFEEAQSPEKYLIVLEHANHYIFVDECGELALRLGFFESCSDDVWDMARAHDLINHFATAFLRVQLYDDAEAAQALDSETVDFPAVRYEVSR
jgi:predicted dienelactone hydrolase